MGNAIDLKGAEEVLQQFDYRATPFFEVKEGKDLKFKWMEGDLDAARECLALHLHQLYVNGSTAPYKIVFYSKVNDEKYAFVKDSELGSNTFRLNQPGMNMQNYHAVNRGEIDPAYLSGSVPSGKMLDALNGTLISINSRLEALESPLYDETEDEEGEEKEAVSGTGAILGALAGIIKQPEVQSVLAQKLIGFLDSFSSKLFFNKPMNTAKKLEDMTDQDVKVINDSLQILFSAGMVVEDLQKLANIAATSPSKFTMLLGMLKSQ